MSVTVIIKPKESFIQSAFKDLVTFALMGFCIYISGDSTFWTFFTGLIFLLFSSIKVGMIINKQANSFEDAEGAKSYIDKMTG